MLRKVEFIGSGYEVVKFVMVDTETMAGAIAAAQQWYQETGQDFHYCELEIPKEYAYDEPGPKAISGLGEELAALDADVSAVSVDALLDAAARRTAAAPVVGKSNDYIKE